VTGNDPFNPFTGMETYSSKYVPKKRILPDLKSYPFSECYNWAMDEARC
jgi:hypothetical protein